MEDLDIRPLVLEWVSKVGKRRAAIRMVDLGLALTTVDKLVRGRYVTKPSPMMMTLLLAEMAKDGIKAS